MFFYNLGAWLEKQILWDRRFENDDTLSAFVEGWLGNRCHEQWNFGDSNTDGSFTGAVSNSFLSP